MKNDSIIGISLIVIELFAWFLNSFTNVSANSSETFNQSSFISFA